MDRLALGGLEVEPNADIVATHLAGITAVDLILASVGIPNGLGGHGTLLLPIAFSLGSLTEFHDEIDGENGCGVVAEGTLQLASLYLGVANEAHRGSALVGQSLAQVQEDVALPLREGEAAQSRTHRSGGLGQDVILAQAGGVVARGGLLIGVFTAIGGVVYLQIARCGHQQQTAQLRTAHSAQAAMGEAGEELIVGRIGRGPPLLVFVETVQVGSHHVEGHDAHHALRTNGSGIGRAVVAGADKGVDLIDGLLRRGYQ